MESFYADRLEFLATIDSVDVWFDPTDVPDVERFPYLLRRDHARISWVTICPHGDRIPSAYDFMTQRIRQFISAHAAIYLNIPPP